jgi:hypothetical protein
MFNNDLNRIRSGFIVGAIAALIFALPSGLFAQSSPLTVQPSTGRVGVGTTAPTRTLTVQGTAIVGQSASAPGILLQTNGSIADIPASMQPAMLLMVFSSQRGPRPA